MLAGRQLRFARPALFRRTGVALLAVAALALPAQAQVLVGNATGTTNTADGPFMGFGSGDVDPFIAQEFSTGTNTHGYRLESVELFISDSNPPVTGTDRPDVSVCPLDNNGDPDQTSSDCIPLTVPTSITPAEAADTTGAAYMAPARTVLSASTTYSLYISGGGTGGRLHIVTSDTTDPGSQTGWALADNYQILTSGTWSDPTSNAHPIKVKINGASRAGPPRTIAQPIPGIVQDRLLVGNAEQLPVAGGLDANNAIAGEEYSQEFTVGPGSDFLLEEVRLFNTPYSSLGQVTRAPNYSVSVCGLNALGDPQVSTLTCTELEPPVILSTGGIDSNGNPLPSEVADAANPGSFLPLSGNRFVVPSGTTLTLSASTTYSLYIDIDSEILRNAGGNFHTTSSGQEDAGSASGWRLANEVERRRTTLSSDFNLGWLPQQGKALRVRLFGAVEDEDALISNAGETPADGPAIVGTYSQEFSTGADTGGVLWSVDTYSTGTSSYAVSVCDLDEDGDPNTGSCAELTAPSSFVAGANTFTVSSGVRLSAGTTYSLYIVGTTGSGNLRVVTSAAEDTGGATGWSIADVHQSLSGGSWSDATSGQPLRVSINGSTFMQTPATGMPTISGATQVGRTLTVATDAIMDANGLTGISYNYQWVRVDGEDETDIVNTTSRTYTPVAADAGRQLKVKAMFRDNQGNREERISEATAAVHPAARACRTGNIWCATLTVARPTSTIPSEGRGYCDGVSGVAGCTPAYGSLSDTDFTLASTTHTIKSLRWGAKRGRTADRQASLHLGLDRDLPAAELGKVTLVVDSHSFLLDEASRNRTGAALPYHYRWTRPAELGDYVIGQKVTVDLLHADTNDDPEFASATLTRMVQENSLAGVDVGAPIPAATDADMDPLTYRMTGADAVFFDFDATTRQITTRATSYDFETRPSYTVTVHATDDRRGTDTVEVTISLTDAIEQAVPASIGTAEYVTNLNEVSFEYGFTREWPGIFAQSFEVPSGAGVYPVHSVSVDLGGGSGRFDETRTYARLRVADGNRPGAFVASLENPSPTLAGVNHFTAPPGVVLTAGVTYFVTLGEGIADAGLRLPVRLTDSGAELGKPGWSIGDEVISRSDPSQDWAARGQSLKMAVRGPSRPATGAPIISGSLLVGQELTAVTDGIADADGLSGASYSYQWIRVDMGAEADIEGATSSAYTLAAADLGRMIRVRVTFTDDLGNREESTSAATVVVAPAGSNIPPAFTAATQMLTIAENAVADEPVGTALEATDADPGDTVTYTMEGQDAALFDFDASTRQISTTTGVTYDFEARARYAVVVKASDDNGGEDTLVVGIELSDVDEPPAAPDTPTVERTPGSSTRLTVGWIPPANNGPAVTNYDLRYCDEDDSATDCTMDSGFTIYTGAVGTGNSAVVKGLEPETLYQVQVRGVNLEGPGAWSAGVEGSTFRAPFFDRNRPLQFEVSGDAGGGEEVDEVPAAVSPSGATLTYSMEGADAEFFAFDAADRRIETITGVTYSAREEYYTVTIRTDDGTGGTDTLDAEIFVDSKARPPSAPPAPTVTRTSGSDTSLDVSWTEPTFIDGAIESYDLRYCQGATATDCDADSDFTASITGLTATMTAALTGLTTSSVYFVQVKAHDENFEESEWSESGYGKTGNNAPVFGGDATLTFTLEENTGSGQSVGTAIAAATDSDTSDTLTYTMEGADAGSFSFNATSRQISTTTGVTYDFETKSSYTVVVRVTDGNSGTDTVEVTINLRDVNETPTSENAEVTMEEDTVYAFQVEDFPFMDPDDGNTLQSVRIISLPNDGTLNNGTLDLDAGNLAANRDIAAGSLNDLTFTPVENANGSAYATFEFQVADQSALSSTQTMTINVLAVDDRPTSEDTSVTMEEDTTYTFQVADFPFMDVETTELVVLRIEIPETAGELTLSGLDVRDNNSAHRTLIEGNSLVFTPEPNAFGSPYATFGFRVNDTRRDSPRIYTMTINVTPTDDPPDAPTVTQTLGVSTSVDARWTAPDNISPITSYDVQYCRGAASACTSDARFSSSLTVTTTMATLTGLMEDTVYQVRVQSNSVDGASGWSEFGEIRTGIAPYFGFADAEDPLVVTFRMNENTPDNPPGPGAVAVFLVPAATDPGDVLFYSMEGADAEFFRFGAADRRLQSRPDVTYDFETRSSYTVTIRVVDRTMLADTMTARIRLNDLPEPPGRLMPPTVTANPDATTSLDVAWTAPAPDLQAPVTGYVVRWCLGEATDCDEETDFVAANSLTVAATETSATITGLREPALYQVQVRAVNARGDGEWSGSGSEHTGAADNAAPVFADAALTREVEENSAAGVDVGDPIPAATDAEGDALTYSMGGADAPSFAFDAAMRQIQTTTGVTYDRGTRAAYTVTIEARDGRGGTDTVEVTINVTGARVPPSPPVNTGAMSMGSSTRLEVTWTAPTDSAGPPITGYEVRWCQGDTTDCDADEDFAGNSLTVATTTATITGLTPDTLYQVQVRSINDDGVSDWSPLGDGEGRTDPNNLPVFADAALTREVPENSGADVNVGAPVPEATDADGDALVSYGMAGADAAFFSFDDATRQISTRAGVTYDFEARPSYTVTILVVDARDGEGALEVTIRVTDDDAESPGRPNAPTVTAPQGLFDRLVASWTPPTNTGPAITDYEVRWCEGRASDCGAADFVAADSLSVTTTSATITGLAEFTYYQVQVRAISDEGESDWSDSGEGRTERPPNNPPVFATATLTISVPENSAPGTNVGTVGNEIPAATDPDGDTLTYSMGGADAASFRFDAAARQIQTTTGVTYDRATNPSYTVTIVAQDDRNDPVGRAELTVVIELTVVSDEVAEAWLARFGNTVAGQLAEVVGTRLNMSTMSPTQLNLGGSTLQNAALSGVFRALSGETAADAKQTLANSSFVLPLSGDEGGHWTAWGRGAYTEFDGEEGNVDLDGEVTTGTIGMDLARGDWLTGVALSHSEGDGDSRSENGGVGEMDIELSSVSPYARVDLEGGLSVWGMAGYGEGDLERKREAMETEVDLEMRMAAVGIAGPVGSIQGETSDFGLTLKADALAVRMEADGEANLPEVESDAQRLRLLLSGAGYYALESGGAMSPNMEAGVRWDEGDAETGLGVEIGVGVRFADAGGRFSADLAARGLAAHEESSYDEWGVSGAVALAPGHGGRGLSLRLESGYGQVASSTQELWSRHDLAGLAPAASAVFDSRLGLEMAYGFNGLGGRGAWTPYLAYQQGTAAELRVGTRLDLGETMRLELSALRREERQDIGFQLQGRW